VPSRHQTKCWHQNNDVPLLALQSDHQGHGNNSSSNWRGLPASIGEAEYIICCSDVFAGVVGTYCVGSIGAEGIDVNDLVTCQCQETAKQAADVAIRADCYWYEAIITMN
jgi:hypothetical protein